MHDLTTIAPPATCPPWCVDHLDTPEGGLCRAADVDAPAEDGQKSGAIRKAYDEYDGTRITLACKTGELTPAEARHLGIALLAVAL